MEVASGHAGAEVEADVSEDDDRSARHVLARVITNTLDNRRRAGVAHGEAFPGPSGAEELTAGRAVEDGVAEQHGVPYVAGRRQHDDAAAAHPLPDVVVRLADQLHLDARGEEGAEALAGTALEPRPNAAGRRRRPEAPAYLDPEPRTDCTVGVAERVTELADPLLVEHRCRVVCEPLAELASVRRRLLLPFEASVRHVQE